MITPMNFQKGKVYYRVHNIPQMVSIPIQINSFQALTS